MEVYTLKHHKSRNIYVTPYQRQKVVSCFTYANIKKIKPVDNTADLILALSLNEQFNSPSKLC